MNEMNVRLIAALVYTQYMQDLAFRSAVQESVEPYRCAMDLAGYTDILVDGSQRWKQCMDVLGFLMCGYTTELEDEKYEIEM